MKTYSNSIALVKNSRGIYDLDVSKGCYSGLSEDKNGCYGDCYAARTAKRYGVDFSKTVLRYFRGNKHRVKLIKEINKADRPFIRIGCSGDPSENWEHTLAILNGISSCNKEIVIITRHWNTLTDDQLSRLSLFNVCVNTSVSALDDENKIIRSVNEYSRLKPFCKSYLRIVSCDFNKENHDGLVRSKIQERLFKNDNVIDTVFRPTKNNPLVVSGVINVKRLKFMNSKQLISKFNRKAFIGHCSACKEQCGVFNDVLRRVPVYHQLSFV